MTDKTNQTMLKRISECDLTDGERFAAVFTYERFAIDMESGAYLFKSRGRGKGGLLKFILIVPKNTPVPREKLFTYQEWDSKDRKFIRAWSDSEGLAMANVKLEKVLAKRQSAAIGRSQDGCISKGARSNAKA